VIEAKRFPAGCVASPHHLATAAGVAVLASGGNALDAAVATNLTLGVVTPYLCGYGGDLFAMVWRDDQLAAYSGCGRAPAEATADAVRAAAGAAAMPEFGPLTVTVPGAVEAWFTLLDRFGTRDLAELAGPALRYARDGFALTQRAADSLARSRERYPDSAEWQALYGQVTGPGWVLRQPGLAHTIGVLMEEGPDEYYRGPVADSIAEHLRSMGGLIAMEDLAGHRGEWVEPLSATYRDVEVFEMPPPTQGVTALEALNIVEALGDLPADGPDRHHLLIEATKLALADRDAHVTDPDHMVDIKAETLASPEWGLERSRAVDRRLARDPNPGRVAVGGTAYMCAADADGMCVSLIQSNYEGFGSGVTVPGWGINLQNRGAFFALDPTHVNVVAPRKRTMHTLIPAMAFRGNRPWLVFGAMGGDGQVQTHVQLLARIVDDREDVQRAIDAPRWVVSPRDWTVVAESRFESATVEGLRRLGHRLSVSGPYEPVMGHAHAIAVAEHGYLGGTDPRAEGAVAGL
jgi:gamma-glutamyltranspeptidase/glutathione hydrolase